MWMPAVRVVATSCVLVATATAAANGVELGLKGGPSLAEFSGADKALRPGGGLAQRDRRGCPPRGPSGRPVGAPGRGVLHPEGTAYHFDDLDTTVQMDHVEFPLLLKARFGAGLRPYALAGPYVGVRF